MLKRKITEQLTSWKTASNHKPLIIKGCRQCGKTFSVKQFAEENYKSIIYVNFIEQPEYAEVFKGSLAVDNIMMRLTALHGVGKPIIKGNTCIILDEIQECPDARSALKFFCLDGRYDVLCTGSLLGVKGYGDKEMRSVPVGYETIIEMYPLDFEEFLWANGIQDEVTDYLKECMTKETPVQDAIHNRMRELFRQYVIVGGMPEVVSTYIEEKDLSHVLSMQRDIIEGYKDDMIKYASKTDKAHIRECFESIPNQLAKDNKKFQYSIIRKKGTASMYAGSIQWIEDAGIVCRCYNLTIPELPLAGNAIQDVFKVYMSDSGLFVSMLEDGTQFDILNGNMGTYKGAIYENIIADIFHKMGCKLYYYRKDSGLEIDFVIRYKGECMLVEVKSTTGNTKSSKTILAHPEKYHVGGVIKLGDYNIGHKENILTLPLYMSYMLNNP